MLSANFKPKNSCGIARFPCDSTAFLLLQFIVNPKTLKFEVTDQYKFGCVRMNGDSLIALSFSSVNMNFRGV